MEAGPCNDGCRRFYSSDTLKGATWITDHLPTPSMSWKMWLVGRTIGNGKIGDSILEITSMNAYLRTLRNELCQSATQFCRKCFRSSPYEQLQNPPNIFRIPNHGISIPLALIFDKPNDNTTLKSSPLVPITIYDDRAGIDRGLHRAQSHSTLLQLCRVLHLIPENSDSLDSDLIYITNAVKCDMCFATGTTGRVKINARQVAVCRETFLFNELAAVNARGLVFFGANAQEFVLGESTPLWLVVKKRLNSRDYWVLRVPHTSPTSFNTHGGKGAHYLAPFQDLQRKVAAEAYES